ncbi:MAG: hypothetical protein D6782_07830, partial [Alphaproteobacteria bacterium]
MTDCRTDGEGRIKMATVSAADADAVAASYRDYFGYRIAGEAKVDEALAALWGTPEMAGRRFVVMGPESGTQVFIRIVDNDPVPDYAPLKSFGWAALEITVKDVEALHARLQDSPFEIIGPPAFLDFSDKIYPMQAVGLAGEPFYLNEVRGSLPLYDLPIARSFVDHIFITILATPDMQAAIDFYTQNLGWAQGNQYEVPYSVINNAFGLPAQTKHKLSMTCVGRDVNNEVDQYPPGTTARPTKPGLLPPGIASVSFIVEDLDA